MNALLDRVTSRPVSTMRPSGNSPEVSVGLAIAAAVQAVRSGQASPQQSAGAGSCREWVVWQSIATADAAAPTVSKHGSRCRKSAIACTGTARVNSRQSAVA